MSTFISRTCTRLIKQRFSLQRRCQSGIRNKNILVSPYADIDLQNCTVSESLWQNLDKWPDKTAVTCAISGRGYTFSQMHRMSVSFAASLRSKLKLQIDDVVAIILPNVPEYPCAILGALQAGCIVTSVNPLYKSYEIERQLKLVNCKAIISSKLSYTSIMEALKALKWNIPVILTDSDNLPAKTIKFADFAEDFTVDSDCLKSVQRSPDDVAVIPFSSGTTGMPKGVVLTHRNMVAGNQAIVDPEIIAIQETTDSHQDVFPAIIPFFHIFGMVVLMLNQLHLGCKLVTLPSFNPEAFLKMLVVHKISAMFCVPPIAVFLGKHPAVTQKHLQYMRSIICGAAPLSETDAVRLHEKNNKMIIRQGYGLTETSGILTISKNTEVNYASVGYPVAHTEVKIIDIDTGESLEADKDGEICVRGPTVMSGYYKNDAVNKEVFADGGWYKTGDIGHYDKNNCLFVTDRLKELIKVKGFQVAPAELEGILRIHPKVLDCAVIGIPDKISGELPKAFLVLQPGQQLGEEEIKSFVNEKVVDYKNVHSVQFVESIPKNPAGKILRKDLKEKYC